MDSSKATNRHFKTLLAGNPDNNVVYCQDCNILDLNLGALTMRLNPEALETLCSVLNQARVRLEQLQAHTAVNQPSKVVSGEIVH